MKYTWLYSIDGPSMVTGRVATPCRNVMLCHWPSVCVESLTLPTVAALVWNLWLVLVMESTNVFEDDTDLVDRALTLVVGRVQEEGPCPGPLDSPGVMCPLTNACTTPHMIQIHLKKAKGPNEH